MAAAAAAVAGVAVGVGVCVAVVTVTLSLYLLRKRRDLKAVPEGWIPTPRADLTHARAHSQGADTVRDELKRMGVVVLDRDLTWFV